MHVKIRGGTVIDGNTPLCQTCRHATIVKGSRLHDEIVECGMLGYGGRQITFPVTYCTNYSDRRQPALREMQEIAWVLRTDARRHEIGFVRSSKLRDHERYVLTED
jgi:hypothetical protein